MVTVISAIKRNGSKGDFMVLEIQSGIEMIQSQKTGKFYATARKCTVPSSFDERTALSLIGSQMPGNVVRVQSDPYQYTIKDTGEVIQLTHSYEYRPETPREVPVAFQSVSQAIRNMVMS